MSTRFIVIGVRGKITINECFDTYSQARTSATRLENDGYEVIIKRKVV